jgi:hypothetical protein
VTGAPEISPAERAMRLTAEGRWSEAVRVLNRAGGDPVMEHARRVFAPAFLRAVRDEGDRVTTADLEGVLLLVRSGRLQIEDDGQDLLVERLLDRSRDDPGKALAWARFRPESPAARSVLSHMGPPVTEQMPGGLRVVQSARPQGAGTTALRSVFRSDAERSLFEAAGPALAPRLVLPNVALSTVIDFARVRGLLAPAERSAFFRLVVDLMVVAADGSGRPELFVELDGPAHDDAARSDPDAAKDRIIAAAGGTLLRFRLDDGYALEAAVGAMIKALPATG